MIVESHILVSNTTVAPKDNFDLARNAIVQNFSKQLLNDELVNITIEPNKDHTGYYSAFVVMNQTDAETLDKLIRNTKNKELINFFNSKIKQRVN